MKSIIYTSNTGSTAEYAKLLGKGLNLPVHKVRRYILNRMNTTKKCRNINAAQPSVPRRPGRYL